MSHRHAGPDGAGTGKRLLIALALNVGITVAQVVGALISGSLSLLADAAHNGSDAASLGISYVAWRLSRRPADQQHTFGHRRAETVGALINLTTLFMIGLYLLYEAVNRLLEPQAVGGWTMIIVGAIAATEDALSVYVLRKDRGGLNVRSAVIHLIADTLATLGVIVGGVLILLFDVTWVDPMLTALIALYVFIHGYREIKQAIAVLMDSAPQGFDLQRVVAALAAVPGVEDVHHVHVWRPDEDRVALEAHVAVSARDLAEAERIKARLKAALRDRFGVDHATLELETPAGARHDRAVVRDE
jgi:cobalt-zinc-cadmium efflux system protein